MLQDRAILTMADQL